MANRLKEIWQSGNAAVNGWLLVPNGFSAEIMAQAGWDSMTVDLQHGVQDYQSMVHCFQAIQPHGVVPMVRVPSNEPGIIGKALDAGAYGIICPMPNSVQDVRDFISYCRYPPIGQRSNGPIRAMIYGPKTGYQKSANEDVLCIPMIERAGALAELEAILDVPGVDAVYVGPTDLGLSMGLPPLLDREEPEVLAVYERILKETAKRNIPAGIHCGAATYARRMIDMGFKLVTSGSDGYFINTAARAAVATVRGT